MKEVSITIAKFSDDEIELMTIINGISAIAKISKRAFDQLKVLAIREESKSVCTFYHFNLLTL